MRVEDDCCFAPAPRRGYDLLAGKVLINHPGRSSSRTNMLTITAILITSRQSITVAHITFFSKAAYRNVVEDCPEAARYSFVLGK
jgi:hypothetical protein